VNLQSPTTQDELDQLSIMLRAGCYLCGQHPCMMDWTVIDGAERAVCLGGCLPPQAFGWDDPELDRLTSRACAAGALW
jgi:hypothetical protein